MFGGVATPELDPGWGRNVAHADVLDVAATPSSLMFSLGPRSRDLVRVRLDARKVKDEVRRQDLPPSTSGRLHVHAALPEQLDVLDPHVAHTT